MAYEILKSIVEAEARAVEIKKQAVAQAEERKADALKQQEILLEEAKLQGAKEMHQAVEPGGNPKDFKGSGGGLFSD